MRKNSIKNGKGWKDSAVIFDFDEVNLSQILEPTWYPNIAWSDPQAEFGVAPNTTRCYPRFMETNVL